MKVFPAELGAMAKTLDFVLNASKHLFWKSVYLTDFPSELSIVYPFPNVFN